MQDGQPPGVGELIEQLHTVKSMAECHMDQPPLAEEVAHLARLLEQRLDQLISQPERAEEAVQPGMPPNLDLFGDHATSFEQQMALDRAVVLEEMQLWRDELLALSACLNMDGKRVSLPPERMQQWLNRLEAWLQNNLQE